MKGLLVMLWGVICGPLAAWAQPENKDCLWCHERPDIGAMAPEELLAMVRVTDGKPLPRKAEDLKKLYVPMNVLESSVHAQARCSDCHPDADRLPHNQHLRPATCQGCHQEIHQEIARSAHNNPAAAENGRKRPGCLDCHAQGHEMKRLDGPRTYAFAVQSVNACSQCHQEARSGKSNPAESYRNNVHGQALFRDGLPLAATCIDCHGAHGVLPPSDPDSPLSSAKALDTCGRCHQGIKEVFLTSVHGRRLASGNVGIDPHNRHLSNGIKEAATCTTCHNSHGILKVVESFLTSVVQECSHCHLDLGKTYLTSYHGKATSLGDHSVAVCSSCHGAHDILPKSDPASRVAPQNLKKTCSKCHEGVNSNFVRFLAHADHRDRQRFPEVYFTWLIMTTLLLGVLAVFIPHAILWTIREIVERVRHGFKKIPTGPQERYIQRFRPIHRLTHFLIVISFTGLVITGFPLKYSYTDWAKELSAKLGGAHILGQLHRGFAILTFVYTGMHLIYLLYFFLKKCPKPRYRYLMGPNSMVILLSDLKNFWAMIRWFLFLGPRPRFDRWTYLEKFDYWGEIWGVVVIGGTGMILWFPTFFTTWLPGWVLNCAMVVHSIEALLAASVIFLVHFLNTHLRPDKFPVDMVMLTGCMSETEMKEERPAEYERLVATGEIEKRLVRQVGLRWRVLGRIGGILAFMTGVALIALAIISEFSNLFGPPK
ncbi:MAG: hypothetical protein HY717_04615 [Planctomycetes bacterium]|nr:hypothetical protein [Planctomycetota bacterium]